VLRPGGVARIVLPDGALYYRLYVQAMRGEPVTWPYPEPGKPPIYYVNRIMTDYAHYLGFIYDFETLREIMLAAGFRAVNRETYPAGARPQVAGGPRASCDRVFLCRRNSMIRRFPASLAKFDRVWQRWRLGGSIRRLIGVYLRASLLSSIDGN
jgi:hypothetical protein